jgi:hypothetical protein
MTPAALNELESALGFVLPQEYLEVMQDYPFSGEHFGTEMLVDDIETLKRWSRLTVAKKRNRKARPDPTTGYFRIGSDGGELSFFVRPGRDSKGVWYYDTESGEFQKYCGTLREYVEKCRRVDSEEERLPNEVLSVPEWRKNAYALAMFTGFVLFGYAVFKITRWVAKIFGLLPDS